jgi:hypothetical protein
LAYIREERCNGHDDAREGDARSVLKAVEELELFPGRNAYVSRLGYDDGVFGVWKTRGADWEVDDEHVGMDHMPLSRKG